MSKQVPLPAPKLPEGIASHGAPLWKDMPENFDDVFAVNVTDETKNDKKTTVATMRISGPIYDGWMGISASAVAEALNGLPDDVDEIRVRINSPGGDVSQAMEVLNMLRAHKARTVAIVDGIAASAASFLVAGLDERVMSPGTQMMVHDAMAVLIAKLNADALRKLATVMDSFSNSIASIYAQAAGGSVEDWRAVMKEEAWYTAEEAVAANLADRVELIKNPDAPKDTAPDNVDEAFAEMVAKYDLSVFNYAGRDTAPAPKPPTASADGPITTLERGSAVAFTNEQLATMRQKLGLAGDADEATIVAALNEALDEQAGSTPTPAPQPTPTPTPEPTPPTPNPTAVAPGTMVIDSSAWTAQQERIRRLEAADEKRRREERDSVVAQAVKDGKFLAASGDHYKKLWDQDPEAARAVIASLTPGVIPTSELGHSADDEMAMDELAYHYGPGGN